jgi:hypothetical protein
MVPGDMDTLGEPILAVADTPAGVIQVAADILMEAVMAAVDTLVEAVPTVAAFPVDETTVVAEEATTADVGLPATTGIIAAEAASDLDSAITAHLTPTAPVITTPAFAARQATMIAGDIGISTRVAPHIRDIKLKIVPLLTCGATSTTAHRCCIVVLVLHCRIGVVL